MEKIFIIICLMFVLTLHGFCEEEKEYIDYLLNLKLNYPSDWSIKKAPNAIGFISPLDNKRDSFRENVVISISKEALKTHPISLEQYANMYITNSEKTKTDYKLLENGETEIDNKKAIFMVDEETSKELGMNLKRKEYIFFNGFHTYFIGYTAEKKDFDKYLSQVENIINSIRIISEGK